MGKAVYTFDVTRKSFKVQPFDIEADNEADARELALEAACNHDYGQNREDDYEMEVELSSVSPNCEVNRLHRACPGRDISHIVYCPYCDPEGKHAVCIDADEPRKNLMRQSEYTNDEGKNVFRFEAHDWNDEDDELGGHAAFTCTDCGKKIISQFEYTYDDDEWEEIKREREEEENG